jgi:hypothetical protein
VPPQADAITLGRLILMRNRVKDNAGLLAHELVHVRQFSELGRFRFMLRYVGSYLGFRLNGYGHMAAYRRIPLEVEASWESRLASVAELESRVSTSKRKLASERTVTRPKSLPMRSSGHRRQQGSTAVSTSRATASN